MIIDSILKNLLYIQPISINKRSKPIYDDLCDSGKRILTNDNTNLIYISKQIIPIYKDIFQYETNLLSSYTTYIYDDYKSAISILDSMNYPRLDNNLIYGSNHITGLSLDMETYEKDINYLFLDNIIYLALRTLKSEMYYMVYNKPLLRVYTNIDFNTDIDDFIISSFKKSLYHEKRHVDQRRFIRENYTNSDEIYRNLQSKESILDYNKRPSEIDAINYSLLQLNKYRSNNNIIKESKISDIIII